MRLFGCVVDDEGVIHNATDDDTFDDPPDVLFALCHSKLTVVGEPTHESPDRPMWDFDERSTTMQTNCKACIEEDDRSMLHDEDKPFEVWVSHETLKQMVDNHDYPERSMRFNARFSTEQRARDEIAWYKKHGYYVELQVDGLDVDYQDYSDGVMEYPEGSGG